MRAAPLPWGLGEVGRAHGSLGLDACVGSSVELRTLPIVLMWLSCLAAPGGGRVEEWEVIGTWHCPGICAETLNLSEPSFPHSW